MLEARNKEPLSHCLKCGSEELVYDAQAPKISYNSVKFTHKCVDCGTLHQEVYKLSETGIMEDADISDLSDEV